MTHVAHRSIFTLPTADGYNTCVCVSLSVSVSVSVYATQVTFCGYSVPHPLENKMHMHIQTKDIGAAEAMKAALRELMKM